MQLNLQDLPDWMPYMGIYYELRNNTASKSYP